MHPNGVPTTSNTVTGMLAVCLMVSNIGCQALSAYTMESETLHTSSRLAAPKVLTPDPQDTKFLEVLGKRADHQLSQCRKPETCKEAHFLKGLTSLHSNPDAANYHFQKVVEFPPHHHLSQASRVWLWLLDELHHSKSHPPSVQEVTRELVRALLNRDLRLSEDSSTLKSSLPSDLKPFLLAHEAKIKTLGEQIHELSQEVATLKTESASLRSLKKELQARDDKVAELTSQLDALRRIDQELKEKAAPTTPSETILSPSPKEDSRDQP